VSWLLPLQTAANRKLLPDTTETRAKAAATPAPHHRQPLTDTWP